MDNKLCCGCTACEISCPKNAIKMIKDEEGFSYPFTNDNQCIHCGVCTRVCPILNDTMQAHDFKVKKYAAKYKGEEDRLKSSSGGVYTAISNYILEKKGIVYASVFNSDWRVTYSRITSKEKRDLSRGAKYVQSDIEGIFPLISNDLNNGRIVLFVGPSCYCDGLRRFAFNNKYYGNLLIVDMICHGVPSPLMWECNINYLKSVFPNGLSEICFRDKSVGWHGIHFSLNNGEEKVKDSRELKAYATLYSNGYITRPVCHECKYTSSNRVGDISIGDCWGIEECAPSFNDGKGISIILVNSEKGEHILDDIRNYLELLELGEEDCIQPQLKEPSKANPNRETFWEYFWHNGYLKTIKKYTTVGFAKNLKSKIKILIKYDN